MTHRFLNDLFGLFIHQETCWYWITFCPLQISNPSRKMIEFSSFYCHPGGWASLAFCKMSQSSNGLKYSRIADASILSCPVITFMASGHGRDEPIARPALPNPNIFINHLIQSPLLLYDYFLLAMLTLISIQPLCFGKYRSYGAAFEGPLDRIVQLLDIRNDGTGTGWLYWQSI